MNKIISALLLVLLVVIFCCSCAAQSVSEVRPSDSLASSASHSSESPVIYSPGERIKKLFSYQQPLHIKLKTDIELMPDSTESIELLIAVGETAAATDFTSSLGHIGTITKDGKTSMLVHDLKLVLKSNINPADIITALREKSEDYYNSNKVIFTTGTEAIGNKLYDYDKMTDEDGPTVFLYYEAGTENWVFLKSNNQLITILEYDNRPMQELFEIPKGYTPSDLNTFLVLLSKENSADINTK